MVQRYCVLSPTLQVPDDNGPWVRWQEYDWLDTLAHQYHEELAGRIRRLEAIINDALPHLIVGSRLHEILTGALGLPADYVPSDS